MTCSFEIKGALFVKEPDMTGAFMRQQRAIRFSSLWLAANGVSLLALSLILFRLQAPVTFFRYDGAVILTVAKNQADWMPGFGIYAMDFLKGIGDFFPVNTRLMPAFVIGLLGGDGDWLPAFSATWFALEFAVATILVGRAVDFPIPVGILAAWLGLFGALPYLVPTPALELTWGNPYVLSFIAFTMVALTLFLAIGRGSLASAIGCATGIIFILAYLTLISPLWAMVFLPVLGFFGAVGLTMTEARNELRWKLMAAIGLVLS